MCLSLLSSGTKCENSFPTVPLLLVYTFPFRIFSKQESKNPHIICAVAAARCSLHSASEDSLLPASVNRRNSFKFHRLMVVSIGSGSGSSASSGCLDSEFEQGFQKWASCHESSATGRNLQLS
jgi:hypothetical protein